MRIVSRMMIKLGDAFPFVMVAAALIGLVMLARACSRLQAGPEKVSGAESFGESVRSEVRDYAEQIARERRRAAP